MDEDCPVLLVDFIVVFNGGLLFSSVHMPVLVPQSLVGS